MNRGDAVRQPKWNQHEAALLIEAYWKIKDNKALGRTVIAGLSHMLRSRATGQGLPIDGTYRNENGIRMRLNELKHLFSGKSTGLKNTSDLFRQMVQLYKSDYSEYEKILLEAKGVSGIQEKTHQPFFEWLKNIEKMADNTCRSYVSSLNTAEAYAKEHNLPSTGMSCADCKEATSTIVCLMADEGFMQINQKQHNRFSAAFQKLTKYFHYLHPDNTGPVSVAAIDPEKENTASKTEAAPTALVHELLALLKASSNGLSKEDILAHFSVCSTQQVNRALEACSAVKVLKKYHHKENISAYDEMADTLLDVLTKQFAANGNYTSAQQLYNEAHFRLDDFFFYNNAFESRLEVFDLAVHLFTREKYKGNSFLFLNGMHIWKAEPNYPKDFHGLLIKYGREHQNIFTREQALALFEAIGSATPDQSFSHILSNAGSKSFLQYAENRFVLYEALQVNDHFLSSLRIQIENLLEDDDYIAFGEIADYFYTTLPAVPANIHWSPLFLTDMLRIFDIGYISVEAGNNNGRKTIPAAILKKNSPFRTFSDIAWNEVKKAYLLPRELTASEFREFLLDKGFIHGSEKMWNIHKTVAGDLRFYWTEKNSKVTIN